MGFAARGDIWLDAARLTSGDVSFTEAAVIHGHRGGFPELIRDGIQGGKRFLLIVGV